MCRSSPVRPTTEGTSSTSRDRPASEVQSLTWPATAAQQRMGADRVVAPALAGQHGGELHNTATLARAAVLAAGQRREQHRQLMVIARMALQADAALTRPSLRCHQPHARHNAGPQPPTLHAIDKPAARSSARTYPRPSVRAGQEVNGVEATRCNPWRCEAWQLAVLDTDARRAQATPPVCRRMRCFAVPGTWRARCESRRCWTRRPSSGPTRWSTPSPARTSSSSKAPATFPIEDGDQLAPAVRPWLAKHAV